MKLYRIVLFVFCCFSTSVHSGVLEKIIGFSNRICSKVTHVSFLQAQQATSVFFKNFLLFCSRYLITRQLIDVEVSMLKRSVDANYSNFLNQINAFKVEQDKRFKALEEAIHKDFDGLDMKIDEIKNDLLSNRQDEERSQVELSREIDQLSKRFSSEVVEQAQNVLALVQKASGQL